MNAKGYTTKQWISSSGKVYKENQFHKVNTRLVLQNPIYAGKIRHKENIYPGKHEAIISEEIWNKVQSIFKKRESIVNKPVSRSTMAPLLKGIIRCSTCNAAMTPTYTKKQTKHYCYYLCINKDKGINDNCPIARLPAKQIENAITKQIIELLKQPEIITQAILEGEKENITKEEEIIACYQKIETVWENLFPIEQAKIIQALIKSIIVHENKLELNICAEGMSSLINELKQENKNPSGALSNNSNKIDKELPTITKFIAIKRRGGKTTIIGPHDSQVKTKHYNDSIIKAIIKAYKHQQLLQKKKVATIKDIALKENKSLSDIAKIYKLNYLDPDIVDAILEGTQPLDLSLKQLTRSQIPLLWQEQKEVFRFVDN